MPTLDFISSSWQFLKKFQEAGGQDDFFANKQPQTKDEWTYQYNAERDLSEME